jgi:hypothetical protein
MPKGAVCAEVGVWRGDFSAEILDRTDPTAFHLVDEWKIASEITRLAENVTRGELLPEQVSQDELDSIALDVSCRFAGDIERGRVVVHRSSSTHATSQFGSTSMQTTSMKPCERILRPGDRR